MEVIIEALGHVIETLTLFFSYIAPGYLTLIISVFAGLLPYTIFSVIKKMVIAHAET